MKDTLILEGKTYISARRAAKVLGYASDYVGQLCRAGKVDCRMVGRSWFVTEESLIHHQQNAADATQDRVTKNIKSNRHDQVIDSPPGTVSPTASLPHAEPVVSTMPAYKYETERVSLLPQILKQVPQHFSLPKRAEQFSPAPFVVKKSTAAIDQSHFSAPAPLALSLLAALLAVSGLLFSLSLATTGDGKNLIAALQNFSLFSRSNVAATADSPVFENTSSPISDFNGIGVMPATNSAAGDEAAKQKIRNSFSDEVTVHPDQSGTAGVIRPVFKKANGDDFLYVLVPVEESTKK